MSELAPSLVVRQMTLDDLDAVVGIDQQSFPLPWPKSTFRYELSQNRISHLLVGECSFPFREIVGFVGFWLLIDEAHISTFAVHPRYRRQGIGEFLLRAAIHKAASLGTEFITLEVRASNESARRLYQKLGFEVIGRRPRYYRDNAEDALVMCLENIRAFVADADGGE